MEGRPMIPAQDCLSNADYGKASHFRLGWDSRPEGNVVVAPSQIDFPPIWGNFRRQPIPACQDSDIFENDLQACVPRTETNISYPAKPLQRHTPFRPTPVKDMIQRDLRQPRAVPVTREDYRWPEDTPRLPKIIPDKWYGDVQLGNDPTLHASIYKDAYQDQQEFLPPIRARNLNFGPDKVLVGDRRQRLKTTHQAEFKGNHPTNCRPPPRPFKESESSIEMGNQWRHEPKSEQKWAYTPKPPVGPRYDCAEAARRRQMTTMKLGDGKMRLTPTTASHYQRNKTEPHQVCKGHMFDSPTPEWDLDPSKEKYITTYRFFHRKPTAEESIRQAPSDPQKGLPLHITTPGQPMNCQTGHQLEFQPPPAGTRKAEPVQHSTWKSHIAFETPARTPATTGTTATHDMLQVHQLPSDNQLPEEDQAKIKSCHITQAWDGQRWFGTEHKDKFTDKYSGPVALKKMDLQKSNVPLGTMKYYHRELRARPVPRKT